MKRSIWVWLGLASVVALPILGGCGGDGGTTAPTPIIDPSPDTVRTILPNGLTAAVSEDSPTVPVGGTLTYTMTLTNTTTRTITFKPVFLDGSPSSGIGDRLTVKDAGGSTAFPLGGFAQVVTTGPSTTLTPGQSVSGTLTVGGSKNLGQFAAAGHYSAGTVFAVQTGQDISSLVLATAGPLEVVAQ